MKWDLEEIDWKGVDWFHLVQEIGHWQISMAMNMWCHKMQVMSLLART